MSKQATNRPSMGDLLKSIPVQPTPVQEVRPVQAKTIDEREKINGFWVDPDLARRVKLHTVNTGLKQREILIQALESYLPK